MPNPYYSPEDFGLTIVFTEDSGGAYEFKMFVVWVDADGGLFYATDSGYSCPRPFEDFHSENDLTFISSKASLISAYKNWSLGTVNGLAPSHGRTPRVRILDFT